MLCALFRNNLSRAGKLCSNSRRVTAPQFTSLETVLFRRYATQRPSPKPNKVPPTIRAQPPAPRRARPTLDAGSDKESRLLRRIELAERLFVTDRTTLYRAPRAITNYRLTAWGLLCLCGMGIFFFGYNRLLEYDYFVEIGHEHPRLMVIAYAITCTFLTAAGTWTLLRARNHIHSIDLVKKSDAVFLQIVSRSFVPFVKRTFVVRPQDMVVDSRFVAVFGHPELLHPRAPSETSPSAFTIGVLREGLKTISRFFYTVFDSARVFFSQEGIITLDVQEERAGKEKVYEYYVHAGGSYLSEDGKIFLWDLTEMKNPYGYY